MEQRTLLAIVLSVFVLLAYNALVVKVRHRPEQSQLIENKELINKSLVSPETRLVPAQASLSVVRPLPPKVENEKIDILETAALRLEFSSIGGMLKKIFLKKFDYSPPLTDMLALEGFEQVSFQVAKVSQNTILYTYETDHYSIEKTYQASGDHLFSCQIKIIPKGNTEMSNLKIPNIVVYKIDTVRLDNNKNHLLEQPFLEYSIATPTGIARKNSAYKFANQEKQQKDGTVQWVGFRSRYFCTIVKPEYETTAYMINPLDESNLDIKLTTKAHSLKKAEPLELNSVLFVGPQDLNLLASYKSNFQEIMNFNAGGFVDVLSFGMTDIIAKGILHLMNGTHKILRNWGVSIIVLGGLIYLVTYPLTLKSMSSMKKMQLLQPEIAKIREVNKNNPEKLNREIMEFYKKNKFNPFAGCLPMFLQMPIFVALYQVLSRSFTLKGSDFLWIKDLSEPDRLTVLPHSLPVLGNEINILPLLVAAVMFVQQKLSSKNLIAADPAQVSQQKIMTMVFPVMMGVLFYRIASGVALYFFTFYCLSTLAQWKMSKLTQKAS